MKCVSIKGEREFEVKNIDVPQNKKGMVKIHISKSGICGSDIHYWVSGSPAGLVMGHEFCGNVIYNGGRSDLKEGDRVTALPISPCGNCEACHTGNIQYCKETWNEAVGLSLNNPGGLTSIINVRNDMVIKVPDSITDDEVAMVEPTAVGLHAIHLANIKVGDKVLVVGGGIIGLVSAMFAKKEGASYVAISETNPKRGELAKKLGVCDEWFLANETFQETFRKVVPNGFDKVIECCGNTPAVTSALTSVKSGGTVVLVGVSLTPITIPSVVSVLGENTIIGAIGYTKEEFVTCIDLMERKLIDVMKFKSKEIGLNEVQKAYEELTSGNSDAIKIIVNPNI